jgi:3-oxoisoapionate decarboxylase
MTESGNSLGLDGEQTDAQRSQTAPSPALWAFSPPKRERGEEEVGVNTLSPIGGEGSCERIQFLLPSLVRRGSGGGRKSRYTNPLESPLTKGDTRKVVPKPIFSHLQGARRASEGLGGDTTRRGFLYSFSALVVSQIIRTKEAAPPGAFGIAYTSFPIRTRQSGQSLSEGADPIILAEKFIDLCKSFGADGCQMDVAQLSSTDETYLKRLRTMVEEKAMFLELSANARVLESPDELARLAQTAHALGASRLRIAINGRRYEEFFEMKKWKDFASHWQDSLEKAEPLLKQHRLLVGIENHKEWLSDELAEMLRRISSSYLGACVDFGNNLALLEDSLEVAQKLAPFAVTTHMKDMALSECEQGFLLSEVPLGQGILPLAKIMEALRRGRSDIHFCLEMITRDPLQVPYLDDKYWATYEKRDNSRIEKFKSQVLNKASLKPLPKISGTSSARMLAIEDDNIRRCVSYSKRTLGL